MLVARGTAAQRLTEESPVGTTLALRIIFRPDWAGITQAVGGGPVLVRERKPVFRALEAFSADQLVPRTPRTAVGQLANGRILFVATDGRQPGYSVGMTNFELAQTLVRLGAVTGSAFDAGGSTTLAFDGTLLNRPSDPRGERDVSTSLQLMYYGVYVPAVEPVVSPNGDGVAESQRLAYKVVRPSTVTATLTAPDGRGRVLGERCADARHLPRRVPAAAARSRSARRSRPPKGRGGSTSRRADDQGQTSTTRQTFAVNNTLGAVRLSASRLVARLGGTRRIQAGVDVTRPARVTVSVETRSGVSRRDHRQPQRPARAASSCSGTARPARGRARARLRRLLRRSLLAPRTSSARSSSSSKPLSSSPMRADPEEAEEAAEDRRAVGSAGARRLHAVGSILSELTDLLTTLIGDYGLYAVFALMLIDAVLPAASEAGDGLRRRSRGRRLRRAGRRPLRRDARPGLPAYLGMALAGTIGYTIGSIGRLVDRQARRQALPRAARPLAASERGQARPGRALVRPLGGLGRLPRADHARSCARSSRSRPVSSAAPLGRYTLLTLLGSAIWAFAFAGAGWALGSRWEEFHHAFRYVDYRDRRDRRGRDRVSGLEAASRGAEEPRAQTPAYRLGLREDPARRREGAVRAARAADQGGLRRGSRGRQVRLRAERRRVRGGGRRLPRDARDDRRRERHRRARARPERARGASRATR